MNIAIRRNMTISKNFTIATKDKKSIEQLLNSIPKITPEQQAIIDDSINQRRTIERKIWEYLKNNPTLDLDGELITPETHEVGFDTETKEIDGCLWLVVKEWYVRPKKSEFDKEDWK